MPSFQLERAKPAVPGGTGICPRTDRRCGDFIERLSIVLVTGAIVGALIVLLDFKLVIQAGGQLIQLGSGFAAETKGMVLQSMLISGFAAVVAYWLGTTKQGQDQAQSVNKIAEAAAPAQAAAVAAATGQPIPPTPSDPPPGVTP